MKDRISGKSGVLGVSETLLHDVTSALPATRLLLSTKSEPPEDHRAELPDWVKSRALEQASIGVTITDPKQDDNPIVYANQGFLDITGYPREEVVGRNCRFLQGPDTEEETVKEIKGAIESEQDVSVEILNYRADGTPFWNHLDISPVYDDDGVLTNFFGFQRDVTERRRHRQRMEHEKKRLDEFAGLLSHDVRNPLTVAMGGVEMALESGDVDDLEMVQRAHERIEAIVDNTLRYVREGKVVDEEFRSLHLEEVVRGATEEIYGVRLEVESSVEVEGDEDALKQMFENLLRNSAEHGASTVYFGSLEARSGFYVEDDGEGIPESERDDIWGHGYSTDGTTGIGLSIVQAVVEAHGWRIEAVEGTRGGARFEVEFVPGDPT